MRLIVLSQYYPPETGAPQNRLSDLNRHLKQMGHSVTVLTAMPNYPKGQVYPGYERKIYMRETVNGIPIVRTWIFVAGLSIIARLVNYFSFVATSLLFGAFVLPKADLLLVESPPLFLGISAYLLCRLKGCRMIMNVADLWPQAAVELHVISNPRIIRWATRLEEFLYMRSDLVLGLTEGIVHNIKTRFPQKNIRFLPGGADVDWFRPAEKDHALLQSFGLEDKFVVGYGGNHGYAQALGAVIEAGEYLRDYPDIVIALFGDGPFKPELESKAKAKGFASIRFFPWQPRERMPRLVASWDAALVSAVDTPLIKGALPSKMFEAMGSGVPVLLSLPEGEASAVIRTSNGGCWVKPEDPRALADAIKNLYRDKDLRLRLGANGRTYVAANYDRRRMAERFVDYTSELFGAADIRRPTSQRE